ncbi:replication initiation factor domain-containing protein [Enterococcus faecium]|uniref:replication initiation factor domain-containing protein n=1 Tax=Enterococcus faecium TaxID=1352 RepID=UPI0001B6E8B3|nr:replication initiation factor domain-containing protein [Enterococcus faecium]EEV49700.1 replication initiation factor [Enterococcus faecium 1,141,733]EME3526993.1 replication initiation factor domain-containing protein [Enterococcus faecium]EME7089679.1 replication initiation factor domain-containing protein [Enterococcus faecium]EME7185540.1 replication initiation factor domain-containing protein [Enterococcus faecium]EMF0291840.1 replication initiation factor domain-containing protein [E
MRNVLTIDWFACTVKHLSPNKVIEELLCMEMGHFSFEGWGSNKYKFHYSCGEINVYFNGDTHMGVFVQLKGQGCRQYSEFFEGNENNWVTLTTRFYDQRANFTRIDICHDLYCGKLKVATVYQALKNGQYVGTARIYKYHEKGKTVYGETIGETVVIGVEGSQQLAIYNKLMEQAGKSTDVCNIDEWVRVELRLWAEKANLIATQIVKKRPLRESIRGYYRFVVPNSKIKAKRNRPIVSW